MNRESKFFTSGIILGVAMIFLVNAVTEAGTRAGGSQASAERLLDVNLDDVSEASEIRGVALSSDGARVFA